MSRRIFLFAGLLALSLPSGAAENLFSITPYVQRPATNAMSILFFTKSNVKATVKCWRADGHGETNSVETTGTDTSSVLKSNMYQHRVRFENLRTHTDYRYEVTPSGGASYANTFRTLPDKNTPVRFIGICDTETTKASGGATDEWDTQEKGRIDYYVSRSVGYASNIVHMVKRQPDLITISGDLAAKGYVQDNWDEFWRENAGGLGLGYNDPAGSIPILSAIGNHDLKDGSTVSSSGGGESALKKFLTYFEFNPNGVKYEYSDGTTTKETRDTSELFHRTDLGPVTLIFLDTNKGDNTDCSKWTQDYADRPEMRAPDFNPGSLQYTWLTNNLADAQRNSRFTFVINHHCPYSVGQHARPSNGKGYSSYNTGSGYDGESGNAVRILVDTMIRYGVDGWLCGHDEIQEHSQRKGKETLPDGTQRDHTVNIYDLGSGGDGLRGAELVKNSYEVFRAYEDDRDTWENGVLVSGGCHYGHLEVDVTTNKNGKWTCSLTPAYVFIYKDANSKVCGFERRCYRDRIIIDEESDEIVYQQAPRFPKGSGVPSDYVEYVRPPQMADESDAPPEVLEHPAFVPYTRVTRTAGGPAAERVGACVTNGDEVVYSLLSERGRDYALGTNGVAVGAWVAGDGTPQLLVAPKLEGGGYQVLVKEPK